MLALLCALVFTGAPAGANPPTVMPDQVVDSAGVLTPEQEHDINASIDDLAADRDLALWVIYVKTFDDKSPEEWGRETESLSTLSYRDVLLAVAVDSKEYYLGSAEPIEDTPQEDLSAIGLDRVEPAVETGKWAAAATGTADALLSGPSNVRKALLIGGLLAAVAVGVGLWAWLRRNRDADSADDDYDGQDRQLTVDELATQNVETLDPWSLDVLTNTDNAITTSADELALAETEASGADGRKALAGFHDALDTADSALATAFRLRQQLDTDTSITEQRRHDLLVEIITMCSDADADLDDQVRAFDGARDLSSGAADRLDALAKRSATQAARVDGATADEKKVCRRKTNRMIADTVDGNVDMARELTEFADDAIAQGQELVSGSSEASPVGAIRSAEGALDAVTRLLDAVEEAAAAKKIDATVEVNAAEYFIDTRRGAVGATARTRLSEAARLLDAGDDEDQAAALAEAAVTQARADVDAWHDAATSDTDSSAPVLAGVLVDVVLRSPALTTGDDGQQALGAGGFSSGGRSPGSFGGPDTTGRVGTGERR